MSVLLICYGQSAKEIALVPYPQKVVLNEGCFDVAGADIRCIGELDSLTLCLADRFASNITFISGKKSEVKFSPGKGINLINDLSLSPEAYELTIKPRKIEIRASSLRGFNWAFQTLKQKSQFLVKKHKLNIIMFQKTLLNILQEHKAQTFVNWKACSPAPYSGLDFMAKVL